MLLYASYFEIASVAELVDASDLKSEDRKVVWVRFPPEALVQYNHTALPATMTDRGVAQMARVSRQGGKVELRERVKQSGSSSDG